MQGQAHIAEPWAGDPDPFPAVRGLGGCSDVGQGRVQLGQLGAPLGSGVKVPAGGGFVQEPFGFAVVIWAVHWLSSVAVRVALARAIEPYAENERQPAGGGSAHPLTGKLRHRGAEADRGSRRSG